jgi:fumarate hydratase class I
MDYNLLKDNLTELIRRTSAFLPTDVENVIALKKNLEEKNSLAEVSIEMILQNIGLAKKNSMPICQDTGTITFYVKAPLGMDQLLFKKAAEECVIVATEKGYLRQNSVDSLYNKNTGNNLGKGSPVFYIEQTRDDYIDVRLVLKGGGCENMSSQYSLPVYFEKKRFDRNLHGVRACIMDAITNAQGKGCAPGFLGVCIGGDRASGYSHAKKQLLRQLDDINSIQELAELEESILQEANQLKIGPMGFGGNFTIGGCKIDYLNRLPASFFVSVSYMCWAFRRRGVVLNQVGSVKEWLYQTEGEFEKDYSQLAELILNKEGDTKIKHLNLPLFEEEVRKLKVGDFVYLNGPLFTGRDAVHKYLFDGGDLDILKGAVIYHCGPVIVKEEGKYKVLAAGPTTSIREEPYQAEIIKRFKIRGVIGKGGMGVNTLKACKEHGAVYLHAVGGAAQIYAKTIEEVKGVSLQEFGSPEAVWHFVVKDFPVVVTMDSHGESLHEKIDSLSKSNLERFFNYF